MAQVAVNIAGRSYRVACDEGEEARLGDLASLLDGKIETMRHRFGEIGDQRLTIMAAIMIIDELGESNSRVRALEAELAELKRTFSDAVNGQNDWSERVAASIGDAALRIGNVADDLAGAPDIAAKVDPEQET